MWENKAIKLLEMLSLNASVVMKLTHFEKHKKGKILHFKQNNPMKKVKL